MGVESRAYYALLRLTGALRAARRCDAFGRVSATPDKCITKHQSIPRYWPDAFSFASSLNSWERYKGSGKEKLEHTDFSYSPCCVQNLCDIRRVRIVQDHRYFRSVYPESATFRTEGATFSMLLATIQTGKRARTASDLGVCAAGRAAVVRGAAMHIVMLLGRKTMNKHKYMK
eukprot:6211259-Pleurochrysis_carterae.AAC.1